MSSLLDRPGSLLLLAEPEPHPQPEPEPEPHPQPGPEPGPGAGADPEAVGSGLVGCCHLERKGPHTAYFGMFAVDPRRQGGGVGGFMLAAARERAAGWGCREMRMTVIRQREDLIAWYARHGFGPTGETEPFPYGDERFGRPRRPDLEFVVLAGPVRHRGPGPG